MEQIIGIILTLVFTGLIAVFKEKNKRKSGKRVFEPDDFSMPESHIPPVPVFPAAAPQIIPEEGTRVTADIQESNPIPEQDEAEIAAHRERWRRAIIDSEILSRKF